MKSLYKSKNPNLQERQTVCNGLLTKFPDRIPLICEKSEKSRLKNVNHCKFLVNKNLTIRDLQSIIRSRIHLPQTEGIFMFYDNGRQVGKSNSMLKDLHSIYKDEDGFLYITYIEEVVFG